MTPEEAEKHWQADCLRRLEWLSVRVELNPVDKEYIGFQMKDFITCFKSVLREEIEKEINRNHRINSPRLKAGLRTALEIMERVIPKK